MSMTILKSAVLVSAVIVGGGFAAQAQTTSTDTKMPMAKEQMEKPSGATSAGPAGDAQNLRGHSDMKGKTDGQSSAENLRGHSETPKDTLKKN